MSTAKRMPLAEISLNRQNCNLTRNAYTIKNCINKRAEKIISKLAPPSKDIYKPCPGCQSPAKTILQKTSQCTKCSQKFCLHCFYGSDKHFVNCKVIGGNGITCSIPKKIARSEKYTLCVKDNRRRLRRL